MHSLHAGSENLTSCPATSDRNSKCCPQWCWSWRRARLLERVSFFALCMKHGVLGSSSPFQRMCSVHTVYTRCHVRLWSCLVLIQITLCLKRIHICVQNCTYFCIILAIVNTCMLECLHDHCEYFIGRLVALRQTVVTATFLLLRHQTWHNTSPVSVWINSYRRLSVVENRDRLVETASFSMWFRTLSGIFEEEHELSCVFRISTSFELVQC